MKQSGESYNATNHVHTSALFALLASLGTNHYIFVVIVFLERVLVKCPPAVPTSSPRNCRHRCFLEVFQAFDVPLDKMTPAGCPDDNVEAQIAHPPLISSSSSKGKRLHCLLCRFSLGNVLPVCGCEIS